MLNAKLIVGVAGLYSQSKKLYCVTPSMAVVRVGVRLMRKVGWHESAVHDSVYPAHAVHHSISQLLCGDVVLWSTSQWRSWSRSWSSQLLCNTSVARKCRAPIDQHCRRRSGDDFQRRNDVINALVKRRRPLAMPPQSDVSCAYVVLWIETIRGLCIVRRGAGRRAEVK